MNWNTAKLCCTETKPNDWSLRSKILDREAQKRTKHKISNNKTNEQLAQTRNREIHKCSLDYQNLWNSHN